jgi:uncharacterized protein YfdQ (DUF2303 family)
MLSPESIELLQQSQAITAACTEAADAIKTDGIVMLPSDFQQHDLELHMPLRRRARGVMSTNVVADFSSYVKDHKHDGATIFVNGDNMSAVAVLNLGTPEKPGHADDKAVLNTDRTAAYQAMRSIATGQPLRQVQVAEFMEDWTDHISCRNDDGGIEVRHAIAAVRKLTIESMRKLESAEQQLSAERSTFESVKATSADPIPTSITFKCEPHKGLAAREFSMRLGIVTTGDKPSITLRIIKLEQHAEEMARELAELVKASIAGDVPVLIGGYTPSK